MTSRGFSLIDIIVSIGVIAAITATAGSVVSGSSFRSAAGERLRASLLAENVLEAARVLPGSVIPTRDGGPPIGILIPWGTHRIMNMTGAPTPANVLVVTATSTAVSSITSVLPLPIDYRSNFDLSATVELPAGTPDAGRAGLLIRARDLENGYRLTQGLTNLLFEKIQDGAATTLLTSNRSASPGVWYRLRIVAAGTTFQIYRDGSLLGTATDTTWSAGELALAGLGGALPAFDQVQLLGETTWNFDADRAGALPTAFHRLGPLDLPNGKVTLSAVQTFASSTLRTLTATVAWLGPRGPATATAVTNHP